MYCTFDMPSTECMNLGSLILISIIQKECKQCISMYIMLQWSNMRKDKEFCFMPKLQWGKSHTVEALQQTLSSLWRKGLLTTAFTKPCFPRLDTNSVFLHSRKQPAPVMCPKGVHSRELPLYFDYII